MAQGLERKLVGVMRDKGATLVTVESCTGGGIADRITQLPGSSDVFWGALVTYQERAKVALVGISPRLLKKSGAVSREVAAEMAEAGFRLARRSLGSKRTIIAVSTTGIAGPGGGTARTPVGLCYIGVASSRTRGRARVVRISPKKLSRSQLKSLFAELALLEVLREVTRSKARRA